MTLVALPERPGLDALRQRLGEAAAVLLPDSDPADLPQDAGQAAGELLRLLVEQLVARPDRDAVWLLLVALSATFPLAEEVRDTQRQLELASVSESTLWLLEWAHAVSSLRESGRYQMRVVTGGVVVDVDYTAKHNLQTGIQRVVRRLVPRWVRDHDLHLAVWSEHAGALRAPYDDEQERVLRWVRPLPSTLALTSEAELVVPWRSTVVLPEVPGREQCSRLASLAEHSGNRMTAIAYDCIPVLSADLMPEVEPNRFAGYLSLVKHADVLAGISAAAAQEFRGFVQALPAQGLTGPAVVSCPLATEAPASDPGPGSERPDDLPEVLIVGSHEPRKNHLSVLHASEVLWRGGLRFRLRFVGGSGWTTAAFDAQLEQLIAAGRPVSADRGMDDDALWTAYRRARITVFPSLHEGYGLPVVESLALGTPVIATRYGSIAELAAGGGMALVDPRDDDDLIDTMRRLLTDDDELARLREQALSRPVRSWDDYARDLWDALVRQP